MQPVATNVASLPGLLTINVTVTVPPGLAVSTGGITVILSALSIVTTEPSALETIDSEEAETNTPRRRRVCEILKNAREWPCTRSTRVLLLT